MALQKQNLSISFSKGIDSKTDPKQVVTGKLLMLKNATFQSSGRFKKRNGYGVLNASLSSGSAIAAYNDELIALDGSAVYSYGSKNHDLTLKGKKVACELAVDSIVRNSYQQTNPDSIALNGILCFGYDDSSGSAMMTVMDQATKKVYISGLSIPGSMVKASAIGNFILISYVDNSSPGVLKAVAYDTTALTYSTITIANCGTLSKFYDVAKVGSNLVFATSGVDSSLVPACSIVSVSPTLSLGTVLNFTGSPTFQKCVFDDGTGQAVVAFNTKTSVQYIVCNTALSSYSAPVTVETINGVQNLTGIYDSTGPVFFYEVANSNSSTSDSFVKKCKMVSGAGTPSVLLRSVGLWTKPFKYGSSIYLTVTHDSTLQACYFIVDSNGSVISRLATENGGGLSTNGVLREVFPVSANSFQFAYLIKDFVSSLNGNVFTQTGVNSVAISFAGPVITQTIGNSLNLSGGVVSMYDGQTVVEKNFHLYPDTLTAVTSQAGGGLQTGTYQYAALYEWTDNKGQIHQSAQSVPVTLVTAITRLFLSGSTPFAGGVSLSNTDDIYKLGPGMSVTGPGVSANTFLVYPDLGTSQNVATGNSGTYTYTPGKSFQGSAVVGSAVVSILAQVTEYYLASTVAGSALITLSSFATVKVGSLIQAVSNGTSYSGTIISQSGSLVSVDTPVPFATDGLYFQCTFRLFGKTTNGSAVMTNASYQGPIVAGDQFAFGSGNNIVTMTVVSVSGSTITFNIPFTTTSNNLLILGYMPIRYPSAGDAFSDLTGNFGSATVKSIGNGTVTLNSTAAATSAKMNFVTGSAIGGLVTIPTLRVTAKQGVSIALYRTLVNQSVFYRCSSLTAPLINSTSVDSVNFLDTVPDSLLIGNEQLYTTGEVVDNFPPPASSVFWTFKNRSMIVPSESNRQIWFSKPAVPGVSVEFSDQFVINVPEEGGAITAGAQLDDKNIIFKRGAIFAHAGDGPANTGAQNDFGDPQKIASDSGCINQKSIVLIPSGLMFQSEKGIYLLDRSLSVKYIGSDVEAYNSAVISSAKLISGLNQVRFSLTGSDTTLVYDYLIGEWAIFTNPEAKDAAIYKNAYSYIAPSGKLLSETPGLFVDDSSPILLALTTSWLSFAGLQSFQRVYKMLILGEYKSPHALSLNIAYDFKDSYNQSVTIPVPAALPGAYQFRVDFSVQKCEAIQITLSETQTAPFGEGMSLSAFGLEVGAKKGLNKLPGSQSYG